MSVPQPQEPATPIAPPEPATPAVPQEPIVPADPTPDRETPPPNDPPQPQPDETQAASFSIRGDSSFSLSRSSTAASISGCCVGSWPGSAASSRT